METLLWGKKLIICSVGRVFFFLLAIFQSLLHMKNLKTSSPENCLIFFHFAQKVEELFLKCVSVKLPMAKGTAYNICSSWEVF